MLSSHVISVFGVFHVTLSLFLGRFHARERQRPGRQSCAVDWYAVKGVIQLQDFAGREANIAGAEVVNQVRDLRRARDGYDPGSLRQQPGQCKLPRRYPLVTRPVLEEFDNCEIARAVVWSEPR